MPVNRSSLAVALAATIGLSLVAVAPAHAATKAPAAKKISAKKKTAAKKKAGAPTAKVVTACVNSKTGATKVLLGSKAKKKCAKGWTKMTWNVSGQNGADGKNGASGANGLPGSPGIKGADGGAVVVFDAEGNRIGRFAGGIGFGLPLPAIQVLGDDGGLYLYLESGQLLPSLLSMVGGGIPLMTPVFTDSVCTGPAYLPVPTGLEAIASIYGGSSVRYVHRALFGTSLSTLGPARVWKPTATLVGAPATPLYALSITGTCDELGPLDDGALLSLESVPAPPDGVGPLTLG